MVRGIGWGIEQDQLWLHNESLSTRPITLSITQSHRAITLAPKTPKDTHTPASTSKSWKDTGTSRGVCVCMSCISVELDDMLDDVLDAGYVYVSMSSFDVDDIYEPRGVKLSLEGCRMLAVLVRRLISS